MAETSRRWKNMLYAGDGGDLGQILAHGLGGMMAARILVCAVVLSTPLLMHVALTTGRYVPVALALAAIEVSVGSMLVLRRWRGAWVWLVAALALGMLRALVAWGASRNVLSLQSGLSHGLLYSWLLLLFGRTLLPGRQPLVTTLANRLSGQLCAARDVYTRRVTQAWCLFCLFQLASSALLIATAPVAVWSLFVNVLDLPLLCLMFLGEYAIRRHRFRHEPHASLGDSIRAFAARDRHAG
jgi:uncharacterized membrane protein